MIILQTDSCVMLKLANICHSPLTFPGLTTWFIQFDSTLRSSVATVIMWVNHRPPVLHVSAPSVTSDRTNNR